MRVCNFSMQMVDYKIYLHVSRNAVGKGIEVLLPNGNIHVRKRFPRKKVLLFMYLLILKS